MRPNKFIDKFEEKMKTFLQKSNETYFMNFVHTHTRMFH